MTPDQRTRWPQRPPANASCDAHVGASYDQCGAPVLNRCPNPAVETAIDRLGMESWLCETCVESLAERGKVRRNPRRAA